MSALEKNIHWIEADTLEQWLGDGAELALIDTSEAGLFGNGHVFQASNLPLSRLELLLPRLVPRTSTRLVIVAPDAGLALRARAVAVALGYSDIHLLQGGSAAWQAKGKPLFQGVNVPSKAFAELVELAYHTPHLAPAEVAKLQHSQADLILLDSRTAAEHRRFHIPGAISCAGSELAARFHDLVPSPDTLVVVTCAGRTRGVMGAQTLINAGVPNQVVALAGGTQGWRLAGLELERTPAQESQPPSEQALAQAADRLQPLQQRQPTHTIDAATLAQWQAEPNRTTVVFDIRTPEEYQQGHWPGAMGVQGVQLIQTLDEWLAVRHARVVLTDSDGSRAVLTAHWLQQMGVDVSLLKVQPIQLSETAAPVAPAAAGLPRTAPSVSAQQAKDWLGHSDAAHTVLVDVSASGQYQTAHPQNAVWANRSHIPAAAAQALAAAQRVLVVSDELATAQLFALDVIDRKSVV